MSFVVYLFDPSNWSVRFWEHVSDTGEAPRHLVFAGSPLGRMVQIAGDSLSDREAAVLAAPLTLAGQSYPAGAGPLTLDAPLILRDAATGKCHFTALVRLAGAPLGTVLSRGWSPAEPGLWHEAPAAGARLSPVVVSATCPANNPFRQGGPLGPAFAAEDFLPFGSGVRLRPQMPLLHGPRQQPYLAAGSLILTRRGPVPVEALAVGDLVLTADHGYQPLRWIGRRRIGPEMLPREPELRPIRISKDALGPGQPSRDLLVSPEHRLLIRSAQVQEMFEVREALVAARHLTALAGVSVAEDLGEADYVQLMFDSHEVIFANGALTESLQSGPSTLMALSPEAMAELLALAPELPARLERAPSGGARMTLSGAQSRVLAHYQQEARGGAGLLA